MREAHLLPPVSGQRAARRRSARRQIPLGRAPRAGALAPTRSLPARSIALAPPGRTCLAVAGEDYCIVAASTRLSTGYSILTRDASMMLKLCVPRLLLLRPVAAALAALAACLRPS